MILTDFSTPLEDMWGQQGNHKFSSRTAHPGAVGWDVLALYPDWAVLQSCVCSSGRRYAHTPPTRPLETHTRVYQKYQVLSWYSIMISVLCILCTTLTLYLLPHPSTSSVSKWDSKKAGFVSPHICSASGSPPSLQASPAAEPRVWD